MSVILDAFFRPCVVGNGRVLVTGWVKATQGDAHEVRWVVQEKNPIWPKTAFDPTVGQVTGKTDGKPVWFYAYGFDPSPHEQQGRTTTWTATSGVFSTPLAAAPVYVSRDGRRLKIVASLALCQTTPDSYFWSAGALYANPSTGQTTTLMYSTGDSAFRHDAEYTLYVDWRSIANTSWTNILTQDFRWNARVIDLRTVWEEDLAPEWIRDSKVATAIRNANARRMEDIYSWLEDIYHQSDAHTATWGIPLWEQLLRSPTSASLTVSQRQTVLAARRRVAGNTRKEFFDGLTSIIGSIDIDDQWENLKLVLTMQGTPSPVLRSIGEEYIAQAKPAGIDITLTYAGGFYADVSQAGDPL